MLRLAMAVAALLLAARTLKRKRRSIAFLASALITKAGAAALRRRIKPCRLELAFALLT